MKKFFNRAPFHIIKIARGISKHVLNYLLVILALISISGCQSPPTFEYKVDISANEIYSGINSGYSNHESDFGIAARRVVDYEWQLFVGHEVRSIQLHFDELKIEGSQSFLSIMDATGNELAGYSVINSNDFLSQVFNTNLLKFRLFINSEISEPIDRVHIDSIKVWSDLETWLLNHPSGEPNLDGTTPNVHVLQTISQESELRKNKEVLGLLPADAENYYLATGNTVFNNFDFAVIGEGGGAPKTYKSDRDLWYRLKHIQTITGQFGGGSNEDVVVLTDHGEIYLSLNIEYHEFYGFHLAHRNFVLDHDEIAASGKMNGDGTDDLLAVSASTVRYTLNNDVSDYPEFGTVASTPLPWSPASFPVGTKFMPITGDFDGDGYVDVAIVVDRQNEVADQASTCDEVRVFRNDQAQGFTDFGSWKRIKLANGVEDVTRDIQVGDFNGDGYSDLLLADTPPNYFATERRCSLHVALNHLGLSVPPPSMFAAYETWESFILPTLGDQNRIATIDAVVAGDFNGDGKTDVALRHATSGMSMGFPIPGEPTKITVSYSTISPLTSLPRFGPATDWTPPIIPTGKLQTIKFKTFVERRITTGDELIFEDLAESSVPSLNIGSSGFAETLIAHHGSNPLTHVNVLINKLFPEAFIELPRVGFKSPSDRLLYKPLYAFGDVNGDGLDDLIIFTADVRGSVEVLINSGSSFERSAYPWWLYFANDFQERDEYPLVADVNGDDLDDLVLFARTPSFMQAPTTATVQYGVYVCLSNGKIFSPPELWNQLLGWYLPMGVPLVGDFNRDGLSDAAVVNPGRLIDVALSDGNSFGGINDVDWRLTSSDLNFRPETFASGNFRTADVNGDSRDDIIAFDANTIMTFIIDGNGSLSRGHGFYSDQEGTYDENLFDIGQFNGDRHADIASYISKDERSQANNNTIYTWFSDEGIDFQQAPTARYKNLTYFRETTTNAAECNADEREELVLVRRGVGNTALEVIVIPMTDVDMDLYIQPIESASPDQIPWYGWTALSARDSEIHEILMDQKSVSGSFVIRVHNNGTDPGMYKLISNRMTREIDLDAMFMVEGSLSGDFYLGYRNMFIRAGPRLYNALDGLMRLGTITYRQPATGDLGWWKDHMDDERIDVFLFDVSGRSRARYNDYIKMEGTHAGTFVHEYGHYGFDLDDEYCETPPPENSGVHSCLLGRDTGSIGLCPNSLMAQSSGKEFCTSLYHLPWDLPSPLNFPSLMKPAWENIPMPFSWFVPGEQQPGFPTRSPNPHRYEEGIFERALNGNGWAVFNP